jgi:hypothetical protein
MRPEDERALQEDLVGNATPARQVERLVPGALGVLESQSEP